MAIRPPRDLTSFARDVQDSLGIKEHDAVPWVDVVALVKAARNMRDKFPAASYSEKMRLCDGLEDALKPFEKQRGRQPG